MEPSINPTAITRMMLWNTTAKAAGARPWRPAVTLIAAGIVPARMSPRTGTVSDSGMLFVARTLRAIAWALELVLYRAIGTFTLVHLTAATLLERHAPRDRLRKLLAGLALVLAVVGLAQKAAGSRLIYGFEARLRSGAWAR